MSYKVPIIAALATVCALLALNTTQFAEPAVATTVPVESWVYDLFTHWSAKNGKLYGSEDEKNYRLTIFRDNVLKIKAHQNSGSSYSMSINKFADITAEEFKARYLTLKTDLKTTLNTEILDTTNAPDSVDWRESGIVGDVKDQGQCGSCWAFSAVAALEGLAAQKSGTIALFSEQQLVDCSSAQGNEGCNGGLMDQAFTYVEASGIETEAQYPYKARDQKCKAAAGKSAFKNTGFADVDPNDNDQLKAAVGLGVVSVAIEADAEVFQFYSGGIVNDASCGTQLDHGVAAVGYGTENGQDFWIVRNSWGGSWGDKGYIRLGRQTGKGPGICGIAMAASRPTL